MSDKIVTLQVPERVARILRDLGVIKHPTRTCKYRRCRNLFVPNDPREYYCHRNCSERERQERHRERHGDAQESTEANN